MDLGFKHALHDTIFVGFLFELASITKFECKILRFQKQQISRIATFDELKSKLMFYLVVCLNLVLENLSSYIRCSALAGCDTRT